MARAGLVVAGAVLSLVAILLLTLAWHWFQVLLLFIGLGAIGAGFAPSERARAAAPSAAPSQAQAPSLADLLAELDALRASGRITAEEHQAKRRQLIDAWGRPPSP